jgi:hypothetical protein
MVFAAIAAWLWYKSTTVSVPPEQGNVDGAELIVGGYAFVATAIRQNTWSRRAAAAAAIAAFFQAAGLAASLGAT